MKRMIINRPALTAMIVAALLSLLSCKKDSKGTEPPITGFSADTVWIGKIITINGNGFSSTATENSVRIGSTIVTEVLEASATSLTIKVPAGATSGKVYVSVNGKENSSSGNLTIVNQMAWQKALGGTNSDIGVAVASSSDGGYLLAGYTNSSDGDVSNNYGNYDFWIVKLNADRTIAWQKVLGGSGEDRANSIVALADGGCVVAGYTTSTDGEVTGNHGRSDYWIIKLNASGKIVWKSIFGGSGNDEATSIVSNPGGGYTVAGYSSSIDGNVSNNRGRIDYWVVWLDENGALINQKTYGGGGDDLARSLITTSDGGYLVAGSTSSTNGNVTGNHGGNDYWILKLNAAGSIEWQKALGGTGSEVAHSIMAASDGSSVIAGYTNSTDGDVTGNHGRDDYWIVKLNANGTMAWQKALGGSSADQALAITSAKDGGCAVAGITHSLDGDVTGNHGTASDSWIVRLNAGGSVVWKKALGGTRGETTYGIATIGKNFIAAGYSHSADGDVSGVHGTVEVDLWLFNLLD
ncbi:T9SS C-terminal target domain-containing protein [Niastella caeni]|uniref:T9SS C-terminal target domain-containing protein n=1 Tax=Niastella caeni TaxID=2569763 RepID=A0A4S8HNT4_9BACT|nr:IPT/TIG domain-containing protein [Niastella caeni]THU37050.1 T9SS C-terminal target domain-containing protein [Niastella caeni]